MNRENHLQISHLVGTWALDRFDILEEGDPEHPWGYDMHGLLIYGGSGHMSVAINRHAPWSEQGRPDSPSEGTSRLLFYAGTYGIEGDVVRHEVTEASDVGRIGTTLTRKARLEGRLLTLVADGPGFVATLVWKRVG